MTDEEKAVEIGNNAKRQKYFDSRCNDLAGNLAYSSAMIMAEWKDAQFKSLLESEIERMKVDYPDTSTIQIRRYLEGLVEKLFKEN